MTPLEDDPIIEEIHRVRDLIAEAHEYDLDAIVADMQSRQGAHGSLLVRREPKRVIEIDSDVTPPSESRQLGNELDSHPRFEVLVTARCGSLRSLRLYIVRLSFPLTGLAVLLVPRVIAKPLGALPRPPGHGLQFGELRPRHATATSGERNPGAK